jgi:hypothetical protein
MFVKYPGLTFVGVIGLAVAVAVGAVSFGIINTVVDGRLPLDEGDRVISIRNVQDGDERPGVPLTCTTSGRGAKSFAPSMRSARTGPSTAISSRGTVGPSPFASRR